MTTAHVLLPNSNDRNNFELFFDDANIIKDLVKNYQNGLDLSLSKIIERYDPIKQFTSKKVKEIDPDILKRLLNYRFNVIIGNSNEYHILRKFTQEELSNPGYQYDADSLLEDEIDKSSFKEIAFIPILIHLTNNLFLPTLQEIIMQLPYEFINFEKVKAVELVWHQKNYKKIPTNLYESDLAPAIICLYQSKIKK
ncbi:MAG: hypothetical protein RSA08_03245 [Clostridia bacterium]